MLSARELEVMLLALVAEMSAAGEFRRQRYLLWVGYNQNRLSPERHAVPIVPHHTPRRSRDRTYFSCRPPADAARNSQGESGIFWPNFGDTGFVVGCCI